MELTTGWRSLPPSPNSLNYMLWAHSYTRDKTQGWKRIPLRARVTNRSQGEVILKRGYWRNQRMEWGTGPGVSWQGQERWRIVFFGQGLVVLPPAGCWVYVLCSRESLFLEATEDGLPREVGGCWKQDHQQGDLSCRGFASRGWAPGVNSERFAFLNRVAR